MRKSIAISLLFLILFTGTGCVRLFCECERSGPQLSYPPERFYYGTREQPRLFSICYDEYLRKLKYHTHLLDFGDVLNASFGTVFIMVLAVDFPLEVVLDTLILPVDAMLYVCYNASPPLDKYIYDNDIEGLRKRLEKGADPNAITPWFREKKPMAFIAFKKGKEDCFRLLLEHGAKIPFEILQIHDVGKIGMLRLVFKDGCPKELLENNEAKYVISDWIKFSKYSYLALPDHPAADDKAFADILTMLLELGFPPNEWKSGSPPYELNSGRSGYTSNNLTPLDFVLQNKAMATEAKDRLVAAMRAHGAKTYNELHELP